MAILSDIYCNICKQTKTVGHSAGSHPVVCEECDKKQASDARSAFLAMCASKTLLERLAAIEAMIYDLREQLKKPRWDGRIG